MTASTVAASTADPAVGSPSESPAGARGHNAAAPRGGRDGNPFRARQRRLYIPFVAPAFVLYLAFLIVPLAGTFWISLHKWPGSGPMQWEGTRNYTYLLHDPVFLHSFRNTLVLLFGAGAATFALSFGLTMLLRDMVGRSTARSIIFFPNIVPALVLSILWGFLFQADGLVNKILGLIGVHHPPAWLAQNHLYSMILLGVVWTSTGFYTTIIMAAVDRIPPYLYEDCALAGANAWQRFRHVTLPLSWDVIGICAVLWTINAIKTFEFVLAMAGSSSGLPTPEVWTVSLYAYASAFASSGVPQYGLAAADSIVTLVLVAVLVFLIRRVMRRDTIEF
ncbi:carbohydrate ABC transporter permease [Streptomyces beijiangensis]|uniref:Sugar ABC transporter permease n=1 Tax=Streptomyces beijiangensis TaxID=163361 RepID=A0A939F1E6_9ACTN|nr:sugar ABC transporter permease [Streptomyces beijiangensis]MBO0510367.1 sugar ABC transporter permease [Streptomyces beijiangensis]